MRPGDPVSPRDIVSAGMCIGCGACVAQSAHAAAMSWDAHGQLKPAGESAWLTARTDAFSRTCPFSPSAPNEDELARALFPAAGARDGMIGNFDAAYVGHAAEGEFRAMGSSGGLVSWMAAELLRRGMIDGVVHVSAASSTEGRLFHYRISRTEAEIREGAKSRYYPVELSDALREIRRRPGRYAVVGIPCFVKAVQLLRRQDPGLRERIVYTLGLFCGHMKSARFAESFAWQMDTGVETIARVDYRLKDPRRPANWYTAHLTLEDGTTRSRDWWHLVDGDWGAGFFQNSACDFCDDVVAETADIAFGDAWVEPYMNDGRGTNVVIARSPRLHALLRVAIADGRLDLKPVDAAFVARTQAAGLRHRREGLAYRLRSTNFPRKRVTAGGALPVRRRLIYATRRAIASWSHRVFALARRLRMPWLYLVWARAILAAYQGLAYSRGWIGYLCDRLLAQERSG